MPHTETGLCKHACPFQKDTFEIMEDTLGFEGH